MFSSRSDQGTNQALSHSKNSKIGCSCLSVVFYSAMTIGGTLGLIFLFLLPASKYFAASSWIQTPCEIISSRVGSEDGSYYPEIKYKYTTHGEDFQGEKYRNYEVQYSSRSNAQNIVNQFRQGMKTDCYVNPDNISEAVLNRDFSTSLLLGLLPGLLIFVGVWGIFYGEALINKFANSTKNKKEEWRTEKTIVEEDEQLGILDLTSKDSFVNRDSNGMIQLRSKSSSVVMFFAVLLFALFWNGIISLFVSDILGQWAAGKRPWFETLFMIPFVVVGVGFVGGVFYSLLKCFNPKAQVWVSDQTVELGSSFELQWQFKGNSRSIRRFQIQLVGIEWAQYQQGTSTYTDTEEFYCVDLFRNEKDEFDSSFEINSGQLEVQVPSETMHSFKASNNQIKWSLRFIGDIPYWPDIKEEFEFTILPFQEISTSKN